MEKLEILKKFLTVDWQKAKLKKKELLELLLNLGRFKTINEFLKEVSPKTAVVTLIAGVNSRWKDSFDNPKNDLVKKFFDPDKPRALALVKNLIPKKIRAEKIPVGIYNLLAVRNLGQNIIVYRSHQKEIENEIAKPLGIKALYYQQAVYQGVTLPLGHGDALIQIKDKLKKYQYLLTSFCSDANSSETAIFSLLTLYVLNKYGENIGLILPSTFMDNPKYPIYINKEGLPTGIGHQKLRGNLQAQEKGLSNVGIRAYLVKELLAAISYFQKEYQTKGTYARLNQGNNELALDNFDEYLMKRGKARHLCVAYPYEISNSAKTIEKIPQFLQMENLVLQKDGFI